MNKKFAWVLLLLLSPLAGPTAQARTLVRQVGPDIEVEFQYGDSRAGGVVVAGNFNEWSLSNAVMTRSPDGVWRYVLRGVKPSDVLQYKFVVGTSRQWILDPEAPDTASDGKGGLNGQVVVKQFLRGSGPEEIPADIAANGQALAGPAELPATAAVKPADGSKNLIADSGFEAGGLDGWTLRGDVAAGSIERNPANAHGGQQSFKYTAGKPFRLLLLKRFTGLAAGTYSFRGWAAGGGGETVLRLFARDCGGPVMSTAIVNTGWQKWKQFTVKGIAVKAGECTVGLYVDAAAATWGNVDDLEFYEDATWTRLTLEPAR